MTHKEYNGWTNYETWVVNLWMEGSQRFWSEMAQEALKRNRGDTDDATRALSEQLKDQHEEMLPEVQGFVADLLGAAMSEVNWYEISEHLVEAAKEAIGD